MISPDKLFFILHGLFARKIRSFLTILGICVGIAAVVALVMLSNGLSQGISNEFESLGTDKLIVTAASAGFGPPGTAVSNPLTVREKEILEKLSGAKLVTG
jgi:ABC-type antimicrobial peptide transport system permease subunit